MSNECARIQAALKRRCANWSRGHSIASGMYRSGLTAQGNVALTEADWDAGRVRAVIGPQRAITFPGWVDRDGVTQRWPHTCAFPAGDIPLARSIGRIRAT